MEILAIALGEFFTHFFDIWGLFISRIFLTFFEFLHFLHFWISALFTVLNFPHFFYICGIFIFHLFDNCWISRTFFTFVRFSFPAFFDNCWIFRSFDNCWISRTFLTFAQFQFSRIFLHFCFRFNFPHFLSLVESKPYFWHLLNLMFLKNQHFLHFLCFNTLLDKRDTQFRSFEV